jgi:hypothetical protein
MSWSRGATGTGPAIQKQASAWKAEQEKYDASQSDVVKVVKDGHGAQIDAAVEIVDVLVDAFGDQLAGISASGHTSTDGSGNLTVSCTLTK